MNICVFGGGGQQGKFGYDFCERARSQGHAVTVFSHRAQGDNIVVDYTDIKDVVSKFEAVLVKSPVDLVLYNSTASNYANNVEHFGANHEFVPAGWTQTLMVPVIVPHALAIMAQRHMPGTGAMVFMGSSLARSMDRTDFTALAGYAGGKALQTHLMIALAHNSSNKMTFSSIFPYLGQPSYPSVFDKIYNHLLHITPEWNGRIFEVYN